METLEIEAREFTYPTVKPIGPTPKNETVHLLEAQLAMPADQTAELGAIMLSTQVDHEYALAA